MTTSPLIGTLRDRGFTLAVELGSLRITPASALTPADREAIRAELPGLLAALTPGEAWDQHTALALMDSADALIERLGVDGNDPEIARAAATVASAYATRDMETLRFAVAEFGAVVRGVVAEPGRRARCSARSTDVGIPHPRESA